MSPALEDAGAQWLAQVAAMRDAIANLNLPKINGTSDEVSADYGTGVWSDEDDFSPASPTDDIWDLVDDDVDTSDSDMLDGLDNAFPVMTVKDDPSEGNWLQWNLQIITIGENGLDPQALEQQILAILASDSSGMLDVNHLEDTTDVMQMMSYRCCLPRL